MSSSRAETKATNGKNRKQILSRRDVIRDASRSGGEFINYYSENGLRKVVPYHYIFTAFCKRRWVGERLLHILDKEFNFDEMGVIVKRMQNGEIKVNGEIVPLDYKMNDSDLLEHKVHRHELPILDKPIDIVFEDESLLVVNKPPSMPIHPCGQYHHNSMVKILHNEMGKHNLRVIHRLDRMTSGLVLIGKTYEAATKISCQISDREVTKFYIAEVEGYFKAADENEAVKPVVVDQPLGRLDEKMGLNAVMTEEEGGKPSKTAFIPLVWKKPQKEGDAGSTVVLCRLYTGRTHQVRIHLQYLGYPIVDDPLYNSYDWGETKGAFAKYREPRSELIAALAFTRQRSQFLRTATTTDEYETSPSKSTSDADESKSSHEDGSFSPPAKKPKRQCDDTKLRFYDETAVDEKTRALLDAAYDPQCPDCNRRFMDPKASNLVLRLHAYRYSGSDWSYSAPLPDWAVEAIDSKELEARIDERLPLL